MITNADITLYNHRMNKETRLDEWYRTVLQGVHFYVDHKVNVGDNGLNGADVYKLRIPEKVNCQKGYVQEKEFISVEGDPDSWTLQKGDVIVRGICELEIEKPADLKKQGISYCTVTSWSDNRFGGLPHWRVGGA